MPIASINPATGETVRVYPSISDEELESKLQFASDTYRLYKKTTFAQRAYYLSRVALILEEEKEYLARLATLEMGKTLKAAVDEVVKCAWACRCYADEAEKFLADEEIASGATRSFVRYQPIGPVLAVMPWNFPYWQVFRFAAPALMAGNVGLLKHSSNVPQCALAIEDVFRRAGFPEGAFQTLLTGSEKVQGIIEDPRIKAVTITGSEPAGRMVAGIAGKALKKSVLELGGSDPFIVMPSANLEEASTVAVKARVINNGQSCIAAKRFIVADSIYPEFEKMFVRKMEELKVGDPLEPATEVGPLATAKILDELHQQVAQTIALGGKLLTGGRRLDTPGNFYAPTVLTDIPLDSPAFKEELFGPVAILFRVNNIDEAIELANATDFGLGSSAWTNDDAEEKRFIDELEAGLVFINGMVASDPRLPFGGIKNSGYGRELSSFGIREFVNIKTVWVKTVDME